MNDRLTEGVLEEHPVAKRVQELEQALARIAAYEPSSQDASTLTIAFYRLRGEARHAISWGRNA